MIDYWDYFLTGYDLSGSNMGMATTLPVEAERDIAAELRAAYTEATGNKLPEVEPRRIGFV